MRLKSNLCAVVTVAAILMVGGSRASADAYVWLGVDPALEWCEPLNWLNTDTFVYPSGYPDDSTDKATIGAGFHPGCPGLCDPTTIGKLVIEDDGCVVVNDHLTIVRRLTIENGGYLTIDCGGTLELAGNNVSHKIGGSVYLACLSSQLRISGNATLDPHTPPGQDPDYGKVQGQHNDAAIIICEGKTLTNNITVCGMMVIKSGSCSTTAVAEASGGEVSTSASRTLETSDVSGSNPSAGGGADRVISGESASGLNATENRSAAAPNNEPAGAEEAPASSVIGDI